MRKLAALVILAIAALFAGGETSHTFPALDTNNAFTGANTFSSLNNTIVVDGVKYTHTAAGIQSAVNATPSGGTVFLPPGTYPLTAATSQEILLTKSINFVCAGWGTVLQMGSSVASIPLLHIVPSGIVPGIRIQDCTFGVQSGTPGSFGIQVDTSPGNEIAFFMIDHINWSVGSEFGTGGVWLNNTSNDKEGGIFVGTIQNSNIYGGILCTLCGDAINIIRNRLSDIGISTAHTGVNATFYPGSSSMRIEDNVINTLAAGIHIGSSAIFTQISGNELETGESAVAGSNGAYVDIDGTSGSPIADIDIYKNSFQIVNSSALDGLRINYCSGCNVRDNSFELGVAPAVDVLITANAKNTRIRTNSFNGVTYAQALSDLGVNTVAEVGGYNLPDYPLVLRTRSTVVYSGAAGNLFGRGNAGVNYLYDGVTNNVALAATDRPSTRTAMGTVATVTELALKPTTVASLPSASEHAGAMMYVTDSTTITTEGQTCAGNSSNKALAFSNGSVWKCF